jgi:hypothetical protein
MTYTKKTLSEIKLIHGDYGNFIKGQKLDKKKEKKYKMPPYKDLAASNEIDGEPLDEKCWPGYEKKGMKTMFGKRYPNCVKKKKTRKEEYSDWRGELEEKKEPELPKFSKKEIDKAGGASKSFVKKTPRISKDGKFADYTGVKSTFKDFTKKGGIAGFVNRRLGTGATKFPKGVFSTKGLAKGARGGAFGKGVASVAKGLAKTPKGVLVAGGLIGAVAGARAIGRAFSGKKRKDAAIEKQVDKYVSDRKVPIKKVNYMPDNMYTVKRDKDGKVSGTGDKIRVVPGTRITPKPTQPDNTKKSRFSQHTRMKLGNYGSLSPYDDAIDKQVDKYVKDRKVPVRKIKEEKKMTKAQIKKRDEIADAISTREMNKRYGDKNVKYAIATKLAMKEDNIQEILDKKDIPHVKKLVGKLRKGSKTHAKQADDLEKAMKENTAIENELVIQDWNVDDIKFTEIETVDIIKAKPLKESMSNWREELGEDWQKVNRKDKTDGLSRKAVKAYRRENPGSKLQTAVTKDPKKLKKGSKSAKRRLSFCRRMKGMKKKLTSAKTRRDPDSRINKALRRWNC